MLESGLKGSNGCEIGREREFYKFVPSISTFKANLKRFVKNHFEYFVFWPPNVFIFFSNQEMKRGGQALEMPSKRIKAEGQPEQEESIPFPQAA